MATRVRYARTSDGVDLAYGTVGTGPPLLVIRPLLRPTFADEVAGKKEPWLPLADGHSLIVWDHRGFGLSNAAPVDYTLDASVLDIEAIADAMNVERFDLLAHFSPCHTAIAFAARKPNRVGKLALWNPTPTGWSARATAFADLPDIGRQHFREYLQLVALRLFGWERGQAWVDNMLEAFTYETWQHLMHQMEQMDATAEAARRPRWRCS